MGEATRRRCPRCTAQQYDLHRLLRDKAASGDFMPYTNGEQDVLETVFPVHGLMRVEPPAHRHLAQPSDIGAKCEAVSY